MKSKQNRRPPIGAALILCALFLGLTACTPTFDGSVTKSADTYALEIQAMTGADHHTLELKKGDVLHIQFETVKGSLFLEITAPDGVPVYQGNGVETTAFTLEIPTDGVYTIDLEGKQAQGSIRVHVEEDSHLQAEPVATAEPNAQDAVTVTTADLVGPWHLAEGENDETAVHEAFPGAMEFGSGMEITGDGNISWYIGADGGTGVYTLDRNVLSADMTNDFDGTAMTVALTAEEKEDRLLLVMEYKGLSLRWAWGEGETGKRE